MTIVCLDMEGVQLSGIRISFANKADIQKYTPPLSLHFVGFSPRKAHIFAILIV